MSATTEDCYFWRLSLEIRFRVYDFAYGHGRTIRPDIHQAFVELIFKGRGEGKPRVVLPSQDRKPTTVAEKRLVNKQYLAETIQHLAESNTFRLPYDFEGSYALSSSFLRHVRSLELYRCYCYFAPSELKLNKICPRLQRLKLSVNLFDIDLLAKPEQLTQAAILQMPMVVALSTVRGITDLTLDEGEQTRQLIPSLDRDEGRARLEKLREVVRKMVTRPREEGDTPA